MIISSNFINVVLSCLLFHNCWNCLATFQILSNFGNFRLLIWHWWRKTKKVYIAVTYFEHFRKVYPINNLYNYITYALIYFLCTYLKLPYIRLFLYYINKDALFHWVKTTNSLNTSLHQKCTPWQFVIWQTVTSPTLAVAELLWHWVGIRPLFWFSLVISWCVL